jgi:hypothetical protein
MRIRGQLRKKAPGTVALLAVAALVITGAAFGSSTGVGYSIQRNGKWYWSTDLADSIYPRVQPPQQGNSVLADPKAMLAASGLSPDSLSGRTVLQRLLIQFYASAGADVPTPVWTDGTAVYSMVCIGTGSSIASPTIDINLFHTFRCAVNGARFPRLKALKVTAARALARVKKASPAPASTSALDALDSAEHALSRYAFQGRPVKRTITVVVTGRRDVGLVGVDPMG